MSKRLRIVIAAAAPILTATVLVLKDFILGLKRYLPDCTFNTVTGYLCPGCGNTRSLTYLLNGDILSALGLANSANIPFVQEVHAAFLAVKQKQPDADAVIELGGEDAKIIFLTGGVEQRMNGSCAGGTGAFIDQMATLLA